jgi:hypothetical protein
MVCMQLLFGSTGQKLDKACVVPVNMFKVALRGY